MDTPHSIEQEADRLLAGFEATPLPRLLETARALGREGHGNVISYSRKVFLPLTRLCRDVCGYCTFAVGPRQAGAAYLSPDEVLAIARAGREAGCRGLCSRSATSPSCATRRRVPRSAGSATPAPSNISSPCASSWSARPGCCRTS